MRKLAVWMPVLMVASLLYWTLALGLGGLSLMAFGAGHCDLEELAVPVLPLEEMPIGASLRTDDVASASAVPVELVEDPTNDPTPPPVEPGPGATAF